MEEIITAVSLRDEELQTLLDLARIAAPRLTNAEKLYYDALLNRFVTELRAQAKDKPSLGPEVPLSDS